jgi:hypothetical protein
MNKECRAEHPDKCKFHGVPDQTVTAEGMYQSYVLAQQKTSALGSAFESPLAWDGEQPAWWSSYREEAEKHPHFPTSPELLDVIDSPAGKLAVVWQDVSHEDRQEWFLSENGMGLHTCEYRSVETGAKVGYVNMAYMDDEAFERSYGHDEFSAFRYKERWGSGSYGFDAEIGEGYGDRDLQGEKLTEQRRTVWLAAVRSNDHREDSAGERLSSYGVSEEDIPANEAKLVKDLKLFSKEIKKDITRRRKYWDTPNIDYSKVDDSLKGSGYGSALYVYAARKLGQKGKRLRGSGIQTPAAQAVWKRFGEKFPDNVGSIRLANADGGNIQKSPTLDFRSAT